MEPSMKKPMENFTLSMNKGLVIGAVIGAFFTFIITFNLNEFVNNSSSEKTVEIQKSEKVPLYWVAPMDANYRRDKPGLSPMGMELVAVYKDEHVGDEEADEGVGTIRISSAVENNLGVRTVQASYQTLHTQIDTVGYVTYDQDRLVHIHPRVDGWIEKLYLKSVGDPVKKGQPLYDIYSPELVNAQEELLLALERKNSRLISAAKNRLVALQLPPESIEQLMKSRKVQQFITFFAPQNGVIENLYIREGFFVKPGTMLLSIGDLSVVWLEAEIFERQAAQVKINSPVTMTLDYLPGREWHGIVDFIYPTLNAKNRTVKVRSRFNNVDGEFKPNMFAQVSLHNQENDIALVIPQEALIRTGNQDRVVLALGDGRFKSIAVSVGRFANEQVEILSGLNEGDLVVSSAQFLLDSESSKSSDFKRMTNNDELVDDIEYVEVDENVSSATVYGVINSVMAGHRMVNISREAIEKWERPADTLDFMVSENLDIAEFTKGMTIDFTFEIREGEFIIVDFSEVATVEINLHDNH